jgi:hypothetical protein
MGDFCIFLSVFVSYYNYHKQLEPANQIEPRFHYISPRLFDSLVDFEWLALWFTDSEQNGLAEVS